VSGPYPVPGSLTDEFGDGFLALPGGHLLVMDNHADDFSQSTAGPFVFHGSRLQQVWQRTVPGTKPVPRGHLRRHPKHEFGHIGGCGPVRGRRRGAAVAPGYRSQCATEDVASQAWP
jgi:hypothetical protein